MPQPPASTHIIVNTQSRNVYYTTIGILKQVLVTKVNVEILKDFLYYFVHYIQTF